MRKPGGILGSPLGRMESGGRRSQRAGLRKRSLGVEELLLGGRGATKEVVRISERAARAEGQEVQNRISARRERGPGLFFLLVRFESAVRTPSPSGILLHFYRLFTAIFTLSLPWLRQLPTFLPLPHPRPPPVVLPLLPLLPHLLPPESALTTSPQTSLFDELEPGPSAFVRDDGGGGSPCERKGRRQRRKGRERRE
jgi:hypothetical protein